MQTNRDSVNRAQNLAAARAREVGSIPKPKNAELVARCERDLRAFCEEFIGNQFSREWGVAHDAMIEALERVILDGGQLAIGVPRGTGKSTLARAAALWALCYGHRDFLVLLGASQTAADGSVRSLKMFSRDYATDPSLGGHRSTLLRTNRRRRALTHLVWEKSRVQIATIEGTRARGQMIVGRGLTGEIRGLNVTDARTNTIRRPDGAILDDIQTAKSARSISQIDARLELVNADVLNLAGSDKPMAAVLLATVLQTNDVADQLLDRERSPLWQGVRIPLVTNFPTNTELWEQYADVLREDTAAGRGRSQADEFFVEKQCSRGGNLRIEVRQRVSNRSRELTSS